MLNACFYDAITPKCAHQLTIMFCMRGVCVKERARWRNSEKKSMYKWLQSIWERQRYGTEQALTAKCKQVMSVCDTHEQKHGYIS